MIYKITGGLFFLLYGFQLVGAFSVGNVVLGVLAIVAGIALLADK